MSYSNPSTSQQSSSSGLTANASVSGVIIGLLIPLVTVVGLFVLIGLGKLSADVGVPIIAGIAGVHGGAVVANSSTTR